MEEEHPVLFAFITGFGIQLFGRMTDLMFELFLWRNAPAAFRFSIGAWTTRDDPYNEGKQRPVLILVSIGIFILDLEVYITGVGEEIKDAKMA